MDVVERKYSWDRTRLFIGFVWDFFFFEGTGWVKVAIILTALFGINVEKTVVPHQGGWKGEEEVPQLLPCLSLTACVVSSSDRAPA